MADLRTDLLRAAGSAPQQVDVDRLTRIAQRRTIRRRSLGALVMLLLVILAVPLFRSLTNDAAVVGRIDHGDTPGHHPAKATPRPTIAPHGTVSRGPSVGVPNPAGPRREPPGRPIAGVKGHMLYINNSALESLDLATGRVRHISDRATSAAWKRDGSLIAYATSLANGSAIESVRPDGTHVRRIVAMNGRTVSDPSWSPDGSRLVFAVEDTGGTAWPGVSSSAASTLWVVDADGSHLQQLSGFDNGDPATEGRGGPAQPAWSPDGRHIAYTSQPATTLAVPSVRVLDLRDDSVWTVGDGQQPAWSPDGDRLVYIDTYGDVEVIDVRTFHQTILDPATSDHYATHPTFSPDGRWVAFARSPQSASLPTTPMPLWFTPSDKAAAQPLNREGSSPSWGP